MTIRQPVQSYLLAEYEVYEDENEEHLVGHAIVEGGTIQKLFVKNGIDESYRGQILDTLMGSIVGEADFINSNLSMRASKMTMHMHRFMERFGFQHVGNGIFKRTAGSVRPPSVIY